MLAQGQSSSAKRGGLAADVSSGLIFIKRKKKKIVVGLIVLPVSLLEPKKKPLKLQSLENLYSYLRDTQIKA